MSQTSAGHGEPERYAIRVQGRLDSRWAAWFDGMSLCTEDDGSTTMRGPVVDQAALHGVLQKVRDLGLPLISIARVGPDRSAVPRIDPDQPSTPTHIR